MLEISPHLVLLGDLRQRRVGLLERLPALHRVGQEARARGLQRPAELLGDLHRGAAQHLGVELVGAGFDLLLDLVEQRQELVALDREAVALGLRAERLVGACVPVDQRPVDVEGDKRDCSSEGPWEADDAMGSRSVRAVVVPPAHRESIEWIAVMDLLEYQGKQLFARHGVPVPAGQPARTVEEAVAAAEEIGYPCAIKAQVQIGGRGKLGGIKIANDPRRGRGVRPRDPRHGHPRPHRPRAVDRGRLADRVRVLRVGRLRPLGQGAAGDALDQGRDGHRAGRRRGPGRDRHPPRRPAAGLSGLPRPPPGLRGRRRRRRRAPGRRDAGQALRRVHRRGGDAGRGQPADHHPRARGQGARRQGHARRQRALPPRRERRAARPLGRGSAGGDGQGARPHLRQARRRHRHPRQRRRPVDVDARRRRRGRRRARPTSSTPAAARAPTRSPPRSR